MISQFKKILDFDLVKASIIYFVLGAATIIIALAWNNAFTNMINKYFPNKDSNVFSQFLYAFLLTFSFIVLFVIFIGKEKLEKKFII